MTVEKSKINHVPLVSVLIPCYNHEIYVIGTLESVAASDYKSIELILIDDASKDNSFTLARNWLENNKSRFARVVCIRHELNRGICATLNELIELCRGEYINYLASDDNLLPDGISKQVNFAIRKNADFVFSDLRLIDENGGLISDSALRHFGKNSQKLKSKFCLVTDIIFCWEAPWNKTFIKSDLIGKIGRFDESISFEDRDFVLRVLINGSFVFLPEATTDYRIRLKNRATPGLTQEQAGLGLYNSERKNYLNASGVIKLMLGILVYSYEVSYRESELKNATYIIWAINTCRFLQRWAIKVHRFFMR